MKRRNISDSIDDLIRVDSKFIRKFKMKIRMHAFAEQGFVETN